METKSFKIAINKDKSNKKEGIIIFEGDLSIKCIIGIKKKILNEIKSFDFLTIEIKNIDNIDITFIQLVVSIKNQIEKVTIKSDLPNQFVKLFERAGLNQFFDQTHTLN